MFTYVIRLSNQGDLLYRNADNSWGSTKNFNKATKFDTRQKAREYMSNQAVRYIYEDAQTEAVSI